LSAIQTVQLSSIPFKPTALFSAFQTLGNSTTLAAYPSNLTIPVAIAGDTGVNPRAVFDNRKVRATSALLAFACTDANNEKIAIRLTGFSQISSSSLYLRTQFFLGEAQAGNIDVSTALSETTAFLCDNFSLKTNVSPYVNYIEPTADSSAAVIICDLRGYEYLAVDIAVGSATGGVKAQAWIGIN
jgi:hypothetical protein